MNIYELRRVGTRISVWIKALRAVFESKYIYEIDGKGWGTRLLYWENASILNIFSIVHLSICLSIPLEGGLDI